MMSKFRLLVGRKLTLEVVLVPESCEVLDVEDSRVPNGSVRQCFNCLYTDQNMEQMS